MVQQGGQRSPRPFRVGEVAPPPYRPTVETGYSGTVAGNFDSTPKGVILHGSRSGSLTNSTAQEYAGTAAFAGRGAGGLGWNATIGDDVIALHMSYSAWGWNARGCSDDYLAVEFAQPTEASLISDAQVRAFAWFFQQARRVWPYLPNLFVTHAELDGTTEYGPRDGKTDVFRQSSAMTADLRNRIYARLAA